MSDITISMEQAMTDPKLLGPFVDPDEFAPWLTFWRAAEAQKPKPGDLELYRQYTGRMRWPEKAANILVPIIGRRGKKSANFSMYATKESLGKHPLAPGEWCVIALVSPTRVQTGINKSYMSSYFAESPYLRSLVVNETNDTITLKNRTRIITLTPDFKSVRGFACKVVILDEACFLQSEGGARSDTECVRAFLPSLATLNGKLCVPSSPYGKWGWVYEQYQKYFGVDDSRVLVWKAPSIVMNPRLSQEMIDEAIEQDPEAGRSEWLAEFRSDIASYIPPEIVDACIEDGCYERGPVENTYYVGFCDMAGGSGKDSATLAIGHKEDKATVLDCAREVRPPFSPEQVVEEFSNTLKQYRITTVYGDKYAGDWPRERFQEHGVTYQPEGKSKSEIYIEVLPLLTTKEACLLDNDTLKRQLCALERRVHAGGRQSVDHPGRGHDDVANSACGALLRAASEQIITQGQVYSVPSLRVLYGLGDIDGPLDPSPWGDDHGPWNI